MPFEFGAIEIFSHFTQYIMDLFKNIWTKLLFLLPSNVIIDFDIMSSTEICLRWSTLLTGNECVIMYVLKCGAGFGSIYITTDDRNSEICVGFQFGDILAWI